ncbi:MAG TPA: ATP-binding protein, partial [Pyrinomonadaceae bacterium]|nr:ATP-binding protein [Pyrinomonadaceae bacterium]
FTNIAQAMTSDARGAEFFTTANGERWLAAYQPIDKLDLSVAVAADAAEADAGLQLIGTIGIALTLLLALAAAVILTIVLRRTSRHINRVAEAAAEIAAGNLEQRILVKSTDETRLLAESFNLMSDRLREHIAHEAESKQFQSFLRLSAMLTHDLKNAITGLSFLVNNMERQFHRAEFREDAISSLRAATDKLRAIVARLNEPARTLSGEYRHAIRETDLVPIIRHVLKTTAEPASALHQLESQLPDSLSAPVDGERIERVLENLIINALEAMGAKSGCLIVAAGTEGAGHIFISVCDTGVGMTEEFIRARLFRPFSTTKEKGIGLGLYTCREIVMAHGGRLDVQSKLGAGTCFRVVLPSTPVTRLSAPAAARSLTADRRAGSPND